MRLKKVRQSCVRVNRDEAQIARCKHLVAGMDSHFDETSRMIQLAGNEVRMKILLLVSQEESLCVCDLSDVLEMKIPAVSQHLRKLKDAGLVETRREGTVIYYAITPQHRSMVNTLLHLTAHPFISKAV